MPDLTLLRYIEAREPERMIEPPTKPQAEVLEAFGGAVVERGVLQRVES